MSPVPELRRVPRWQMRAKAELGSMRMAASVLPLAEGLKKAVSDFRKSKGKIALIEPQAPRKEREVDASELGLADFLEHLDAIKNGGDLALDLRQDTRTKPPIIFLGSLRIVFDGEGQNTVEKIREVLSKARDWQKTKHDELQEMVDGSFGIALPIGEATLEITGLGIRRYKTEARRSGAEALKAAVSIAFIYSLKTVITDEEMTGLFELVSKGRSKVNKYVRLNKDLKKERNKPLRIQLLRAKFSIACPKALQALREQSRPKPVEHPGICHKPEAEAIPEPPQLPVRSEREEEEIISRDYPGLHQTMMGPKPEESKVIKDEAAEKPEAPKKKKRRRGKRPAKEEEQPRQSEAMDREEFIASIQLSETARAAIRAHGLSPVDVIFSLFKGFNLGAGLAAVGRGHFRGVYVRRNIRNYLGRAYRDAMGDAPKVGDILDFLKSVDLMKDFGSGPTTKTKDDAMALNTSPNDPVGQDIMKTINAALVYLRNR